MRRISTIFAAAAVILGAAQTQAAPALPGMHNLRQPDGSVIRARIVGDEHFHYYETEAGELLMTDARGVMRPMTLSADGTLKAVGDVTGRATSPAERERLLKAVGATRAHAAEARENRRIAPGPIPHKFPTTGKVTGLILLVEYQDVKFTESATREHYEALCNTPGLKSDLTAGSVLDYFSAQSDGKFTPEFDVYGPITLPHERAYYGLYDNGFNEQFRDACLIADEQGFDFSKYDINEDGFLDFLFLIYAGHGEAQGGPAESVWPAMQDLSNYIFDWFDGLQLGVAACSCELKGGSGTDLDGVGTICHEFSHILGLADIYDTTNQGGYGMAHYDMMDVGSYNDDQKTPSGYTAMDKYTLGWIEPVLLEEDQKDVLLKPFDATHQSIFIVNPENPNEYYTLENRQQQGWDKGLPGHGLVISYCHYEKKFWNRNNLNSSMSAGYEHVSIMAADNVWETGRSEAGDPYPGRKQNTEFSATSLPAALWRSSGKTPGFSVSNIRETEEGDILFDFTAGNSGIGSVASEASSEREIFDINGRRVSGNNLPAGIYIVRENGKTSKISLNSNNNQ